jgi:hypothetical protein
VLQTVSLSDHVKKILEEMDQFEVAIAKNLITIRFQRHIAQRD